MCFLADGGNAFTEHPILTAEVTPTGRANAGSPGCLSSIDLRSFLTDCLTLFCGPVEAPALKSKLPIS